MEVFRIVEVVKPEPNMVYKYTTDQGQYIVRFVNPKSVEFKTSLKQIFVYHIFEKNGEQFAAEVEEDHPKIQMMIYEVTEFAKIQKEPAELRVSIFGPPVIGILNDIPVTMKAGKCPKVDQRCYMITYPSGQIKVDVSDLSSGYFGSLPPFWEVSDDPLAKLYTEASQKFREEFNKPLPIPQTPIRFKIEGNHMVSYGTV